MVVGGGVIGLSIAWRAAREGALVVVLERALVGGQASGAAAGMLAPLAEAKTPGPFVDLGLASLRRYPAFVDALRDEAGLDPELIGPGMLRVAMSEEEEEAIGAALGWQRERGLPLERLSGGDARRLEPALSTDIRAAVLSSEERHVEPRRLVRALALAAARRGVRIMEGAPVTNFDTDNERVTTVHTPTQRLSCDAVVLAGGAWNRTIVEQLGVEVPVFPVRGQILALACTPPPVRHTVYAHSGYLVPKADGRVVVGATEDRAGFDARPTARGMGHLLTLAPKLVPALAGAAFDSAWAGLRPASEDGLPILGPLPGWENTYVAAGHFRNGILLTPITAEILTQGLLRGNWTELPTPFRTDRFARALPMPTTL